MDLPRSGSPDGIGRGRWAVGSGYVEPGHPYAEPNACISTTAKAYGSISEGQAWMTQSGNYAIAVVGTEFKVVELATGNSNNFSY